MRGRLIAAQVDIVTGVQIDSRRGCATATCSWPSGGGADFVEHALAVDRRPRWSGQRRTRHCASLASTVHEPSARVSAHYRSERGAPTKDVLLRDLRAARPHDRERRRLQPTELGVRLGALRAGVRRRDLHPGDRNVAASVRSAATGRDRAARPSP